MSEDEDRPEVEIRLGSVSIEWVESDPGPCPVCGREVGVGPVGFSLDEPNGPRCDVCLLSLSKGLGMLLWMGLIAREMAHQSAEAEIGTDEECVAVLMTFAKMFHHGAKWPRREAAAIDLIRDIRRRLAQLPRQSVIDALTMPPS